eukprot:9497486-Pyramimonas_sp.AAC.1
MALTWHQNGTNMARTICSLPPQGVPSTWVGGRSRTEGRVVASGREGAQLHMSAALRLHHITLAGMPSK